MYVGACAVAAKLSAFNTGQPEENSNIKISYKQSQPLVFTQTVVECVE
jgi:hypothetical protein